MLFECQNTKNGSHKDESLTLMGCGEVFVLAGFSASLLQREFVEFLFACRQVAEDDCPGSSTVGIAQFFVRVARQWATEYESERAGFER